MHMLCAQKYHLNVCCMDVVHAILWAEQIWYLVKVQNYFLHPLLTMKESKAYKLCMAGINESTVAVSNWRHFENSC